MLTTLLGGRAFAERFGSGPADVVALHGWARSRADFGPTLAGYHALAIDLPGFGATPAPEAGWTTTQYAAWVADILRELDRPVLLGHSFGGRVAVQLAARHPELTRGLVLTGVPLLRPESAGRPAGPALSYRLVRALHRRGLVGEARMESLRRTHGSADYRNAQGVLREVLVKAVNETYADQLAAVAGHGLPVAMVWGRHDTAAPVEMARRAQRQLGPAATLSIVPESAHLLDDALVVALRRAVEDLTAGPVAG